MIDLHCHLLPGLDDGAKTPEDSLRIADQLQKAGFREIFVTPHVIQGQTFLEREKILETTENLQIRLNDAGIDLKLYPGGECYIFPDLAKWFRDGKVLSLGNTGRYLLVELPMLEIPNYTEQVFFELQVQGVTPILAHPERHYQLNLEPQLLYEWMKKGVLFQINLRSLSGRYGPKAKETVLHMLRCGLVHFIGSDAHYISEKSYPYVQELIKLEKVLNSEALLNLFEKNPRAILEGRSVIREPEKIKYWHYKRSWRERLLRLK